MRQKQTAAPNEKPQSVEAPPAEALKAKVEKAPSAKVSAKASKAKPKRAKPKKAVVRLRQKPPKKTRLRRKRRHAPETTMETIGKYGKVVLGVAAPVLTALAAKNKKLTQASNIVNTVNAVVQHILPD
jgi:hypothetical protein